MQSETINQSKVAAVVMGLPEGVLRERLVLALCELLAPAPPPVRLEEAGAIVIHGQGADVAGGVRVPVVLHVPVPPDEAEPAAAARRLLMESARDGALTLDGIPLRVEIPGP